MENNPDSVQLEHETNRKPRNARSPSNNRGQALREGYVVDGSGCDCGLQRVIGTSLEEIVEARQQATVQASFGKNAQIVGASTKRIGRRTDSRYAVLGICAGWLERTVGAGRDTATIRRGVSSGICAAVAASTRLESTEAGAARPRTKRGGHRPLASRNLAATKKRALSGKLAWFFSMKVGIFCNRCGDAYGHRPATRPFSVPGIDAIASLRSPPLPALRGRCGWGCTTNCWITTRGLRISFGSCAKSMSTCGEPSYWYGIVCLLIVPPHEDCLKAAPLGSRSNGFRRTRPTLILWKLFGINPSTGRWPTSFPRTSTICTPNWITSWTPFGMSPTAFTRSLTQLT